MKKNIILGLISLLMCSCAEQITTRDAQYPKMYEEKPLSIVVMPPIILCLFSNDDYGNVPIRKRIRC